MSESIRNELTYRKSQGNRPVALAEISRQLGALGYCLNLDLYCRGCSRILAGPRAGTSYPSAFAGISEINTRRSAFHFESRRDANFKALQALRMTGLFAVNRGAIFEI